MPPDREKMRSLKPVFKPDGVVTAGNASQISDGAAALLLASPKAVGRYNLLPRARLAARCVVGSDPVLMLDGPIPATRLVLERAGLSLDEIDVIEINEAFASVVLAWAKELGLERPVEGQSEWRGDCARSPVGRHRRGADDQAAVRAGAHRRALWPANHVHRSRHGDRHGDRAPMSHTVYLGLGTNLGDRLANLQAVRAVFTPLQTALAPSVRLLQASPIYETEPWGFLDQPAFLNQVLQAETDLPPLDLLAYLKDLEMQLGRQPNFRYGPRLIDIDILLYDDLVLSLPGLEIPHPRLAERAFVLVPLADLAPDLRYPGNGRHLPDGRISDGRHPPDGYTLQELLKHAGRTGVVLYSQV